MITRENKINKNACRQKNWIVSRLWYYGKLTRSPHSTSHTTRHNAFWFLHMRKSCCVVSCQV